MNPSLYASQPYSLPGSACLPGGQGPNGADRITRLLYDAAGNVEWEQRAYGTSLQQNYARYGYTPKGRQDWVEDANGNRADFSYDGLDRLSQLNFPSATVGAHAANPGDYEHYGYDENGNRTSLRLRSTETISYHYDALNRLDLKTLPNTAIYYGCDLQGHNLFARYGSPSGVGVSNTFNGFGLQTATTSVLASASDALQVHFLYGADGNRTRVTWPDGHLRSVHV